MMSGFNTELEVEGTRFHIQTEARKESGIETAVYVNGAVIHSLKTSHPGLSDARAGDGEEFMRLVKGQHQQVITQIRTGEIRPPSMSAYIAAPPGKS